MGMLAKLGFTPTTAKESEFAVERPTSHGDRLLTLHDELLARFPGTVVQVTQWRKGDYLSVSAEIEGKRPDGTIITLKAESKSTSTKPNPNYLENFFREVDAWA